MGTMSVDDVDENRLVNTSEVENSNATFRKRAIKIYMSSWLV